MGVKRYSKIINNKEDIEYLLGLTRDDITFSAFIDMFGEFNDAPRFNPYDIFTVPAGRYGKNIRPNKNNFTTTVGKFIFNKIFIEERDNILKTIGWYDATVNKKGYGKLFDKLGYLLLEDKITIDDYKYFCNNTQAVMPFVSILANSFTDGMLTSSKKITVEKNKLLKKYKKELDDPDTRLKTTTKIQNELLDYSRELLKDDPSMDMYNSGSLGSFDNNFKNMFIMKGANKDPDPTKPYILITSNYIDGVSSDEYSKLANTLAEGPYARSKKTESGGWWEKLFVSAFQHIKLLEPGSDCHTKRYITIKVTNDNIKSIMYCYAIIGDKLVEINSDNMDQFIGKTIKLRFSSMCEAKGGICNKCAGNLFYKLGFRNVGVMMPQIPSKIKNIMMKAFHNNQIKLVEMDAMKAFGIED